MEPQYQAPYQAQTSYLAPYPGQAPYQPQAAYQAQYSAQPQVRYVGFWRRVGANLLDGVILDIVLIPLALLLKSPILTNVLPLVISLIYIVALEATRGATLGKMMLGMRVVKVDGSPIGWSEALTRNLLLWVEGLTLYIVTIVSINRSPLKQRWGDKVAGTVVVRR